MLLCALSMFPHKGKENMSPAAFSVSIYFISGLTSSFCFFSFFFFFLCTTNQRYLNFCCVFLVQQWLWIDLIKRRWTIRLFRMDIKGSTYTRDYHSKHWQRKRILFPKSRDIKAVSGKSKGLYARARPWSSKMLSFLGFLHKTPCA